MFSALSFILINCTGYILSLVRDPFWALLVFMNIYFNPPQENLNWWAAYVPFHRWSLLTGLIAVVSLFIHRQRLSFTALGSMKWAVVFLLFSFLLSLTIAVDQKDSFNYTCLLFFFLVSAYCIVHGVNSVSRYKVFLFSIIVFASHLSLKAFLYGRRYQSRLEGIGPADASGSNEFGLLLAAVIPLTLPFLLNGNNYVRFLCLVALPFLVNALVLCNSRGAFLSLVCGMGITMVVINDTRIRKILMLTSLAAIPLFIRLADEAFVDRLYYLIAPHQDTATESEFLNSLSSGRTDIWHYSLDMLKDYPLGSGPNGYRQIAHKYLPPDMLNYRDPLFPNGTRSAHNTYLQILIEQGYVGLILWLGMCVQTLILMVKSFNLLKNRPNVDPFLKDSITMLLASYLSILIGSLFNSRIYYEFFWWQIAICMVAVSLANAAVLVPSSSKKLA